MYYYYYYYYYYYLWPVRLSAIFLCYAINDSIFGKEVIEYKLCVLTACKTLECHISPSEKN